MKSSLFLIVTLFSLSSLLSTCGGGNVDLDNSGGVPLEVIIGNETHLMGPNSYKSISLEQGAYDIIVRDQEGTILADTAFQVMEGGLINLAQGQYYIWTDLYGDPALKEKKLDEDWTEIGDQTFYGEFYPLETNKLYVEKRWDYGLQENFPEDLLGWKLAQEKYLIKSKVFRSEDLVDAYNNLAKKKSAFIRLGL
ncbi:MAG: hypothetical protein AAF694_18120 [Bacteroidota bacterium]